MEYFNFLFTKMHIPFIPTYSSLISSCCKGRKVRSFKTNNPFPPQTPISVSIIFFVYQIFNFSLSMDFSFLFENGVV